MSGKEPFKTVCFLISADLLFDNIRSAHEMFTNQRNLEVIGYCFFYKVCGTMKGALPQFWQSAVYEYERTTL